MRDDICSISVTSIHIVLGAIILVASKRWLSPSGLLDMVRVGRMVVAEVAIIDVIP